MRVRLSTIRLSRNFAIDNLRSGHFYDPPMLSQRGNFQIIQIGSVYVEICFHGLLILFPVQFLTSDVCVTHTEVMMTSSEVMDAFFNNSWLGEDRNVKMEPVCLFRQDKSNDIQHDHIWPWPWPWPNFVSLLNFRLTFRDHLIYHSNRLEEIKIIVQMQFLWLKQIKSY